MHPMLNTAIQAARNASKIILRFIDHMDRIQINSKGHRDLVTEVDQHAENEIISVIRKNYPNHAIIAEESGIIEGDDDCCWIIDPLDGTLNYVHGFPQFCISIAMKRRNMLEVGVIYDPLRNELFTAVRGQGAQLNNHRIRVSACKLLGNALIGTDTDLPAPDAEHYQSQLDLFTTISPKVSGIRGAGAAALDLAYVASGRLDGLWHISLQDWDMAAGILLIQEAGGMVNDLNGEQNCFKTKNIVAGNAKILKSLLDCIQEVQKNSVSQLI